MPERATLEDLCERYGIAAGYEDAWGASRRTPDDTKLALLRAMGIDVAAAAGEASSAGTDDGASVAPTAVIVGDERAGRVALRLASSSATPVPVDWRIDLETGESLQGTAMPDAVPGGDEAQVLQIPLPQATGYHALTVRGATTQAPLASARLIVTPSRCYTPPLLAGGSRIWGLALQLYALRSHRNWGIGDFTDLRNAVATAGAAGADFVGTNPLHALFPARPDAASPYSPSNRAALNVLYIDVEAVGDFTGCKAARARVYSPAFQSALARLRAFDHVDYEAVARLKFEILALLYDHFREHQLGASPGERGRAFRDFQRERGPALKLHGLFDALHEHVAATTGDRGGWRTWPAEYRPPSATADDELYRRHADRAEYFQYLQWQAELQLGAASEQARACGMAIGLYGDFAVGADAGGAETWSQSAVYAPDMHIGAPPDDFNLRGQDWGLPPMLPQRLKAAGYAPFVTVLRAAMRHAGALRIDHVMALMRLFWVPEGAAAVDGAYVAYPFSELLGIVALESRRNRCLVIGEDLGTIGPGVRAALGAAGVLSYRPLYFERTNDAEFAPPERYPAQALVTVGTHDLPTLSGFWTGRDITVRKRLRFYSDDDAYAQQLAARSRDRGKLRDALERAGVLDAADAPRRMTVDLMIAVHRFLARTPSSVMAVQLEDVFGQDAQVNLPSTTEDQYPNWRRKLGVPLESWASNRRFAALTRMLRKERPRQHDPQRVTGDGRPLAADPG
ncbi:MAG TPA: 4-alpha-glucanotransferase [Casimicrobiaceae bacterium]|nr:4-alpha-glucanotransferase [Casimicrobiaceae bacterium]